MSSVRKAEFRLRSLSTVVRFHYTPLSVRILKSTKRYLSVVVLLCKVCYTISILVRGILDASGFKTKV